MATLRIDISDQVHNQLEMLAARERLSVSAFVLRELESTARRAENAALLDSLPSLGMTPEDTVRALREARAERRSSPPPGPAAG